MVRKNVGGLEVETSFLSQNLYPATAAVMTKDAVAETGERKARGSTPQYLISNGRAFAPIELSDSRVGVGVLPGSPLR